MKRDYINYEEFFEEQDKLLAQQFIENNSLNRKEFDSLYWQVNLIHPAINFYQLRRYSYIRLANSTKDIYHDLIMDLDDEKDGIYKQIKISIEHMSTTINQCKKINNRYFIAESVELCSEEEIYLSKTLLKTNYPEGEEFIKLASKKWIYNGKGVSLNCFDELQSIDYTKENPLIVEEKSNYIKCLSRNIKNK